MLYLPVSRSWLFSETARRIYFVSALLALALIATFLGVRMAMAAAGTRALSPSASHIVRMLLFPEIVGEAVLYVGMWYFWFAFDRSHYLKKAVWFVLLFLLAPFGTIFYYFLVYRRGISTDSAEIDPR
jgi:hypothetical protein